MNILQIKEKINNLLKTKYGVREQKLFPEAYFFEDLQLDSLETHAFICDLEKQFDTNLDRPALARTRTLSELYAFIEKVYDEKNHE
jgi:acyl carrier protein